MGEDKAWMVLPRLQEQRAPQTKGAWVMTEPVFKKGPLPYYLLTESDCRSVWETATEMADYIRDIVRDEIGRAPLTFTVDVVSKKRAAEIEQEEIDL